MHVHCGDCAYGWVAAYLPMAINKLTPLMKAPCPMCGSRRVLLGQHPRRAGDVEAWVGSGDIGTSSLTIWAVLLGRTSPHGRFDVPHDPSDFGRCYRLLQIAPDWRPRLTEVAAAVPAWAPFVREWDQLTALYEHELAHGPVQRGKRMAPRTWALLRTLRDEAKSMARSGASA